MSPRLEIVVEIDLYDAARTRRLIAEAGVSPGALMISRADVDAIVARSSVIGARIATGYIYEARHCKVCGCTQTTACQPEPCFWVARSLCSVCEPFYREAAAEIAAVAS